MSDYYDDESAEDPRPDDQWEQGPDEEGADTTEQQHAHVCDVCGDSWLHANDECDELAGTPLPMAWVRRAWAKCPRHEGTDE